MVTWTGFGSGRVEDERECERQAERARGTGPPRVTRGAYSGERFSRRRSIIKSLNALHSSAADRSNTRFKIHYGWCFDFSSGPRFASQRELRTVPTVPTGAPFRCSTRPPRSTHGHRLPARNPRCDFYLTPPLRSSWFDGIPDESRFSGGEKSHAGLRNRRIPQRDFDCCRVRV